MEGESSLSQVVQVDPTISGLIDRLNPSAFLNLKSLLYEDDAAHSHHLLGTICTKSCRANKSSSEYIINVPCTAQDAI